MTGNIVFDKSYLFAIRIVRAYQYLASDKREFVLSKQMLKSGTAIGALLRESEFAQSAADFVSKISIALKEANETAYWIDLLYDTDFFCEDEHDSLDKDCKELIALLASIVKTKKANMCS